MSQVFTIGHSTYDFASFLGLLKQHEVQVMADVRSRPFSGFAWFCRPVYLVDSAVNRIRSRNDDWFDVLGGEANGDQIRIIPACGTEHGGAAVLEFPKMGGGHAAIGVQCDFELFVGMDRLAMERGEEFDELLPARQQAGLEVSDGRSRGLECDFLEATLFAPIEVERCVQADDFSACPEDSVQSGAGEQGFRKRGLDEPAGFVTSSRMCHLWCQFGTSSFATRRGSIQRRSHPGNAPNCGKQPD